MGKEPEFQTVSPDVARLIQVIISEQLRSQRIIRVKLWCFNEKNSSTGYVGQEDRGTLT